ncbi:glycerophosphodiester phosphodiesterase [Bacillaceae bacterium Marseille-Q3522]|nr:glycerophosphodiester phosphodiesterase [Bacillaceae bacterium Marseille-Q3522]
MKNPLITAHTGCMNTPPNSVQSVMEGIKAGADVIEIDIRATKDGKVVLMHDENVHTNEGIIRVQDVTYEELTSHTYRGEIIRLEEVLPLIQENNRVVNLDVKDDQAIDPMIKTVEKYKMRDASVISGCEKERATFLKENYRPYQVLLNTSVSHYEIAKNNYEAAVKETLRDAVMASCCGINMPYQFCREELIEAAGLRMLPVLVWTIDEAAEMKKFIEMGVHSITSKEVETLVKIRDKKDI